MLFETEPPELSERPRVLSRFVTIPLSDLEPVAVNELPVHQAQLERNKKFADDVVRATVIFCWARLCYCIAVSCGGWKDAACCIIWFGFSVAWKNDTNSTGINAALIQSGGCSLKQPCSRPAVPLKAQLYRSRASAFGAGLCQSRWEQQDQFSTRFNVEP